MIMAPVLCVSGQHDGEIEKEEEEGEEELDEISVGATDMSARLLSCIWSI
jgi:hypothetical protein